MRRIAIDMVTEDMILAKSIFTSDGNILLNAGMRLKNAYLHRLKGLDIEDIYVEDEISRGIEINDIISDETRFEARLAVKGAMDSLRFGNSVDLRPIRNHVFKIIDEIMCIKDAMIRLHDLKTADQYTFSHSVNVCVLSVITGVSLGLSKDKLKELGIGAMLHDIGKTRIPLEILNKPAKLTDEEYEVMKKHTNYGYEILSKSRELSTYSSYVALTHHERVNGEGYPLGLTGNNIHDYSRIVSIADVYDAMTSNRVYKKRANINEAVEYLIGMGYHYFDYEYVKTFLEHITIYPPGTIVQLNTKETAIVMDVNKKYPNRPVIRVIKDQCGQNLIQQYELDLTKYNSIIITDIIDNI